MGAVLDILSGNAVKYKTNDVLILQQQLEATKQEEAARKSANRFAIVSGGVLVALIFLIIYINKK